MVNLYIPPGTSELNRFTMKAFTGAALLALVSGFSGLAYAAKADADMAHNANMAEMQASQDMMDLTQAMELTQRHPRGWRAHSGHFGFGPRHHWDECGESGSCSNGREKCGRYCVNLDTNEDHCGACFDEVRPVFIAGVS